MKINNSKFGLKLLSIMRIWGTTKIPQVQRNFLRWYIIIRYNAIFISKSNKISVNPQIPKERFGSDRNAFFTPFKQDFSLLEEIVMSG